MARIEVPMPQMGESIAEGTVSRWLKQVGEVVQRDEAILEISTDKVDAEIPSPAAGVLSEILVGEGKTVEIKTVLGRIEAEAGAVAAGTVPPRTAEAPRAKIAGPGGSPGRTTPAPAARGPEEGLRIRSSPLVRRIAREHGIDIATLSGTGAGGRVTRRVAVIR